MKKEDEDEEEVDGIINVDDRNLDNLSVIFFRLFSVFL